MQFIIAFILIVIMLLEKIYFFSIEGIYATSIWGIVEITLLSGTFIIGIIVFFIENRKNLFKMDLKSRKNEVNFISLVFLVMTVVTVFLSFVLNFSKISVNWDAIALYDARARFLSSGMKFSDMSSLSVFDNLNKYYYLLYPPYTSIAHFFWSKIPILTSIPVGVYYSLVLSFFIVFILFCSWSYFDLTISALMAFLVASNNSIYNVAIKEYTNLPYSLYITVGIFLILLYLRDKSLWKLAFGILLVSTSIWIRYLEPMWFVVAVSLAISMFLSKRKIISIIPAALLLLFGLVEYLSWGYFVSVVGHSPGFINVSIVSILEPIVGIFTGAWITIFLYFIKSWGIALLVSALAFFSALLNWKRLVTNTGLMFLTLIIGLSIGLYFLQLYYVSFQADWWKAAAQSIDRSSTFLIPISALVLIQVITSSRLFPRVKNDVKKNKNNKK